MEDEDNFHLNGTRHQFVDKWKTTSILSIVVNKKQPYYSCQRKITSILQTEDTATLSN